MDLVSTSCSGYRVLFDAAQKPPNLGDLNAPLALVGVGLALVLLRNTGLLQALYRSRLMSVQAFAFLFLGISLVVTLGLIGGRLTAWYTVQTAIDRGQSQEVEGMVENFHPMPYEGHDYEHFTVGDVLFNYSDYVDTGGFNQSSSHGGPLKPGLMLRIHYIIGTVGDSSSPIIVKLEEKCG